MDPNMLFENYDLLMDSPNSTAKMRELILQLAVQGKLVEQDPNDEPASELLKRIKAEGKIKKQKALPPIDPNDAPYELPNGWAWVRNGALFSLKKGKKPKNLSEQVIGLPYLDIAALDRDEITKYTDDVKCPQATDEDILVVCDGSRSGLLLNGKNGVVGSTLAVIDSPSIIKSYLKVLFAKAYQHLNSTTKGAAIPHLDTKKLLATVTGLPPEAEQNRIVAKVDQLMDLCDQLDACQKKAVTKYESLSDAALEKLLFFKTIDEFADHWQFICNNFDLIYNDPAHVNKLRQAILQLAVQGKLVDQDSNDEPASELLKRIKAEKEKLITEGKIKKQQPLPPISEDEIPYELPQSWEWSRLQEAIDVRDGTHDSPKDAIGPDTYPLVTSKNFYNGTIKFDEARRISAEDHINITKRSFVERYDILFSMIGGNLGNQVMVDDDRPFSVKNVALFKYYDRELTSPFFIKKFMEHLALDLQAKAVGGAQPFVSLGFLRKLVIAIPPIFEQKRIVAKVDQLMHLCDELETRLNQSKKNSEMLMQAVLQEAFGMKQA